MKYKLINKQTNEEYLCDKVTIDGFDYYVSDGEFSFKERVFNVEDKVIEMWLHPHTASSKYFRKVIATNNPNIDCPKVIDEAELRDMLFVLDGQKVYTAYMNDHNSETALGGFLRGCKHGYNKSQETHPFSDDDMIEFGDWCKNLQKDNKEIRRSNPSITTKELFQLWKEQQPKIVYYE